MTSLFKRLIRSIDTRRERRLRSFCLLKYSLLSRYPEKITMVNPRDISVSGTSFMSDEKLPINSVLELEICLPPLKGFITVMGNVRWIHKIKGVDQYWIGVTFTAMDPADKKRLHSYIEQVEKDPLMYKYLDKKSRWFKRTG